MSPLERAARELWMRNRRPSKVQDVVPSMNVPEEIPDWRHLFPFAEFHLEGGGGRKGGCETEGIEKMLITQMIIGDVRRAPSPPWGPADAPTGSAPLSPKASRSDGVAPTMLQIADLVAAGERNDAFP